MDVDLSLGKNVLPLWHHYKISVSGVLVVRDINICCSNYVVSIYAVSLNEINANDTKVWCFYIQMKALVPTSMPTI